MCGRGRAGVRQERTAQYGGRMFVFVTTQGVQGDMPSAIARGLREKSKSRVAPCVCTYLLTLLISRRFSILETPCSTVHRPHLQPLLCLGI